MEEIIAIILSIIFWVISYFFSNYIFKLEKERPNFLEKLLYMFLGSMVILGSIFFIVVIYKLIYLLII